MIMNFKGEPLRDDFRRIMLQYMVLVCQVAHLSSNHRDLRVSIIQHQTRCQRSDIVTNDTVEPDRNQNS